MQPSKKLERLFLVLSIAIPLVVGLLFGVRQKVFLGTWTDYLPLTNAILNSSTAVLLILALLLVKQKKYEAHGKVNRLAFLLGSLFLLGYVTYHLTHANTPYGNEGAMKIVYKVILYSHILLAAVVVPFVLYSLYYGLTDQRAKHKKVVKWAFPIWLYVSVSGVVVYILISPFYPWNQ